MSRGDYGTRPPDVGTRGSTPEDDDDGGGHDSNSDFLYDEFEEETARFTEYSITSTTE